MSKIQLSCGGQINLGTIEGNCIYELTKRNDVNTIVEIGTWNGLGSTICVLQGIIDSERFKNFVSVELYPNMYGESKFHLRDYLDYVKLLNGRIIEYEDVFWFDHSIIDKTTDAHANLYYESDLELLKNSENVLEHIPSEIDLLILDGGEYTTYPEWLTLKDRTKIVVLDDTRVLKCSKIREEIINSGNYKTLIDELHHRNGFSCFERNS
jgi:hypothetical protein